MNTHHSYYRHWLFLLVLFLSGPVCALEIFAKGSASKNVIDSEKYTLSAALDTGIAIQLLNQIRLELRYANTASLQNKLTVNLSSGALVTLLNILTQSTIVSAALDLDLLDEQASLVPFLILGVGWVQTARSYYYELPATTAQYQADPVQTGFSANLGLGIRIRIAKLIAIELEGMTYGLNIDRGAPLLNLYGTAGVRFFL